MNFAFSNGIDIFAPSVAPSSVWRESVDVFTPSVAPTNDWRQTAKSWRSDHQRVGSPAGDGRTTPKARLMAKQGRPAIGTGPRTTSRSGQKNKNTQVKRRGRQKKVTKHRSKQRASDNLRTDVMMVNVDCHLTKRTTKGGSQRPQEPAKAPTKKRCQRTTRAVDSMLLEERAYLESIHALPRKKSA